jgi:hypothetical protein
VQSRKKRNIRILNPAGGSGVTSRRNAERYVAHGRARWDGQHAIRFIEEDRRHLAVERSVEAYQMPRATRDDLKHTPVVMAEKLYRVGNDRMPVRAPRLKPAVIHVAGGAITTTVERSSRVVL